jgi:hypothetical protein
MTLIIQFFNFASKRLVTFIGVSYCQFFNTPEGCRRGNTCGFVHSLASGPRQALNYSTQQRSNNVRRTRSTRKGKNFENNENEMSNSNIHLDTNNINNNNINSNNINNQNILVGDILGGDIPSTEALNNARFRQLCHFFNTSQGIV